MSIRAPTFLIPEKCALDLAFDLRGVGFIGNRKSVILVLIAVNLQAQLLAVVRYISEATMYLNIIIDFVTNFRM